MELKEPDACNMLRFFVQISPFADFDTREKDDAVLQIINQDGSGKPRDCSFQNIYQNLYICTRLTVSSGCMRWCRKTQNVYQHRDRDHI